MQSQAHAGNIVLNHVDDTVILSHSYWGLFHFTQSSAFPLLSLEQKQTTYDLLNQLYTVLISRFRPVLAAADVVSPEEQENEKLAHELAELIVNNPAAYESDTLLSAETLPFEPTGLENVRDPSPPMSDDTDIFAEEENQLPAIPGHLSFMSHINRQSAHQLQTVTPNLLRGPI